MPKRLSVFFVRQIGSLGCPAFCWLNEPACLACRRTLRSRQSIVYLYFRENARGKWSLHDHNERSGGR